MNINNINYLSYLDRIRARYGVDKLKNIFYQISKENKEKAITFLNDKKLFFSSLFLVLPIIKKLNLYNGLNLRNSIALKICAKILNDKELEDKIDSMYFNNENTYRVLRWMFKTGYMDDGLDNDLDEVLDGTIANLIITYKDNKILPIVAEMIFARNRKGLLIHEIVWAYFQTENPYSLKIIANYLRSSNKNDVELARKLLNIESTSNIISSNKNKEYDSYITWLNDNYSFLRYTGENYQLKSKPIPFKVDLKNKYMCVSPSNKFASSVTNIDEFDNLNPKEKVMISDYSYNLYKNNNRKWRKWIQKSISDQLKDAEGGNCDDFYC